MILFGEEYRVKRGLMGRGFVIVVIFPRVKEQGLMGRGFVIAVTILPFQDKSYY